MPSASELTLFDQLWEQELQLVRQPRETPPFRPQQLQSDRVFRQYRVYTRRKAAPLRNRVLAGSI